jgi:FixJ family two-component response regulator
MVMPGGMTGKELAGKLMREKPKIKVIYASGYSVEVASRDFPLTEGVNFITKPFGTKQLAQTVRNCLDREVGGD